MLWLRLATVVVILIVNVLFGRNCDIAPWWHTMWMATPNRHRKHFHFVWCSSCKYKSHTCDCFTCNTFELICTRGNVDRICRLPATMKEKHQQHENATDRKYCLLLPMLLLCFFSLPHSYHLSTIGILGLQNVNRPDALARSHNSNSSNNMHKRSKL